MTNPDKITKALEAGYSPKINERVREISARVPGWSKNYHYLFFKSVFAALPIKSVLILGVYQGRDICFMLDNNPDLEITGVDKFNSEPCDDWPPEKRHLTWEEAFNCAPPSKELAAKNIWDVIAQDKAIEGVASRVQLVKQSDADWLPQATGKYDFAYVDTSHDYETVKRQLQQVRPLCHENTIIAGDDYENLTPQWGVKDAVTEAFKTHQVLAGTIWFTEFKEYK